MPNILDSTSAILGSRLGRSVAIANNTPNTSIVAGGPNYNEYQGCIRMFCYNTNTSSMENFDVYGTTGRTYRPAAASTYPQEESEAGGPSLRSGYALPPPGATGHLG